MAQINKPSEHFNTKLYTGTAAENAITGVGFQPDWTWIKNRSITANHHLFDVIRGATKYILTNSANAEATDAQQLKSFDSDGFTVGTNGNVNGSGNNIVSWNWKAGGTASSNTDGSITSSVSANTTSGFSIVKYTGTGANATIGHGLGVAPSMIITKTRSITQNWFVYHKSLGETKAIYLDLTNASTTTSTAWNNTAPTSSVFSVGTEAGTNSSGATLIAYCFAEKKGYSKFGSYAGNGNADGTFVYTGFKPAFLICKAYNTSGEHWVMYDNKRNDDAGAGGNYIDRLLYPASSAAEVDSGGALWVDFLSNGFKLRGTSGNINVSGYNYIYMAFAEQPLVGTNNIPCTAR